VLLTTQYLDEADQLAARIVIVDHGRVIADGAPRALKARTGRDVIEVHTGPTCRPRLTSGLPSVETRPHVTRAPDGCRFRSTLAPTGSQRRRRP
jgi:ABC-2 type transport system ATP-binding protein